MKAWEPTPLTGDQTDALQEIVNIAMGQAGDSLARLLDVFVRLSVPQIRLIGSAHVTDVLQEMLGDLTLVTAIRQAFSHHLRGEAIIIFGQEGCRELAQLMGYDPELSSRQERELLLDVSNILIGACVAGIAEQLGLELSFSPPSAMAERTSINRLLIPEQLSWKYALLLEVNFRLDGYSFNSELLTFMPEETFERLGSALDRFLASL